MFGSSPSLSVLPPAKHLQLGRLGEDCALGYLLANEYELRGRNVRLGRCEIDLVLFDRRGQMIVFVEVKTRNHHSNSYPIHTAVTVRKRRALRRAIDEWITRENYEGPARIDVVCVAENRIIEHLRDIGSDFLVEG